MANRSICIHGHFYQPPREDPITGSIPKEPGASPYNNWNERIDAECYRPNTELGNFGQISFNIGPTLWDWMEDFDPDVCQKIINQDRANVDQYGVGNAMAQAYNHTILPLASLQDKITQVAWGIADFQHRFHRKPQGMWLPETAVDLETLTVLVDQGIDFIILAPWQSGVDNIDTTEPYYVPLPQGKRIIVFFYHQELSTQVSFSPAATMNADRFAVSEINPRFRADKSNLGEAQILIIASDGELYGHHQPYRDRFLAQLVDGAATQAGFTTTFPALWLKNNPPRKEVNIREKTSWSCSHGVMRWAGQCDCISTDGRWKYYLRHAFDRLAATLDTLYVSAISPYISDPWGLRNDYIRVLLGEVNAADLINERAGKRLPEEAVRCIQQLLEAQKELQRMYTSCGFYFEDFSRIEPKNNVAYAAQAVRLARLATGVDLSSQVIADLKHVISHRLGLRGDTVFQRQLQRSTEGY